MISRILRGRAGRNRSGRGVVRSRVPFGRPRIPPVPWIGSLSRVLTPVAIEDYESLSTHDWSEGDFKSTWVNATTPPTGDTVSHYYHFVDVPSGSDEEITHIMQPLRFELDEAGVDGDFFDYWNNPAIDDSSRYYDVLGRSTCSLNTLLPVSGNSHISDGKPTALQFRNWPRGYASCYLDCWASEGIWVPIGASRLVPVWDYWTVRPRYFRLRLNGLAQGSLIDCLDSFDNWDEAVFRLRGGTYWPSGYYNGNWTSSILEFPTNPVHNTAGHEVGWEFDFTAGDVLHIDVWYQISWRPTLTKLGVPTNLPTADKQVLGMIPRYKATTEERVTDFTFGSWMRLDGLKISDGFDPAEHTYTFEAVGGTGNFGDGSAGSHKAEADEYWTVCQITSQRIFWQLTVPGGGAPSGPAGVATFRWEAADWFLLTNSCSVGFIPNPPEDMGDPDEERETACVPGVTGGGWLGGTVDVELIWTSEIAELRIRVYAGGDSRVWFYRPENSSDYPSEVEDRALGDMECGPCGVFNHLGATTFVPWYGSRLMPYTPPTDTDRPTSIIVTKVPQ